MTEISSPLHVVSSQDFEDLFAQLFDLVGHILGLSSVFGYFWEWRRFWVGERGRPAGAGKRPPRT